MKSLNNPSSKNWILLTVISTLFFSACEKENSTQQKEEEEIFAATKSANAETPPSNIEVILRGEGNRFGRIKFRQDNDAAKIIILDT
jgi:hypothetical protein